MYMGMAFLNTNVCRKAAGGRFSVWLRTAPRMKPYDKNKSVFHVLKTIQQDSSVALLLKKVIIGIEMICRQVTNFLRELVTNYNGYNKSSE